MPNPFLKGDNIFLYRRAVIVPVMKIGSGGGCPPPPGNLSTGKKYDYGKNIGIEMVKGRIFWQI